MAPSAPGPQGAAGGAHERQPGGPPGEREANLERAMEGSGGEGWVGELGQPDDLLGDGCEAVGRVGAARENKNGRLMREFAERQGMVVVNTH